MEDPAGPPPTIATSKSGLVITNDSSSFLRMILCHDAANPIRCGIDGPWRAESFCDMPVPSSGHYFCGDRFGSCFNDPGSPSVATAALWRPRYSTVVRHFWFFCEPPFLNEALPNKEIVTS